MASGHQPDSLSAALPLSIIPWQHLCSFIPLKPHSLGLLSWAWPHYFLPGLHALYLKNIIFSVDLVNFLLVKFVLTVSHIYMMHSDNF